MEAGKEAEVEVKVNVEIEVEEWKMTKEDRRWKKPCQNQHGETMKTSQVVQAVSHCAH